VLTSLDLISKLLSKNKPAGRGLDFFSVRGDYRQIRGVYDPIKGFTRDQSGRTTQ
jgi:hypothetical protein